MAALFAPIDEIEAAIAPLRDRVAIAAINAPGSVVISGETSAVETVLAAFARRNVIGQRLFVSLAAHSPLVEPALDRMEALARSVAMSPPAIPIAWNLTGRPLPNGEAPDAIYWRQTHARAGPFRGWRQGAARRWLPDFPRSWAASDAAGPGATIFAARRQPAADLAEARQGGLERTADEPGRSPCTRRAGRLCRLRSPLFTAARDAPHLSLRTGTLLGGSCAAVRQTGRGRRRRGAGRGSAGVGGLFYKIAWEPAASARPRLRAPTELWRKRPSNCSTNSRFGTTSPSTTERGRSSTV